MPEVSRRNCDNAPRDAASVEAPVIRHPRAQAGAQPDQGRERAYSSAVEEPLRHARCTPHRAAAVGRCDRPPTGLRRPIWRRQL